VPAASVAVVPFTNLTGDAGKEYFSDGMAEELINELTKVPGLKVPARTSSFAYKGRNVDIRQIARDLGVATSLEGSVRSAGERIRVTAQLSNAQSGYHIWSNTYEGNFGDVFKVQDDISAKIVEALKSSLNAQLPTVSARVAPTKDPEAYRLYLQGSSTFGVVAMHLFARATARDPSFARAWAGTAIARVTAVAALGAVIPNALADTEHDANRALALDPGLSSAYSALGLINAWRGDWNTADMSFRRAVELAPADPGARVFRTALSSSVGHVREALKETQEAYALAPASAALISGLAATYSLRGQDADAVKSAELAEALGGSNNLTALARQNAALRSGRYVEAGEIVLPTLPVPLRSPTASSTIRRVFAAFGAPSDRIAASHALATLVRTIHPDQLGVQPRQEIILWFVMLGDVDAAFEFANRSVDEFARAGTVGTTWGVLWLPEMRSFRKDPRFQAFVTRLKLMDYWKQHGPPDECDLQGETLVCR